ncbi:MAG: hypothetical protein JNL70_13310 [Saprospiraceae bacterium]|nr:hypothetical protein [Saprospiraceae bacterium]
MSEFALSLIAEAKRTNAKTLDLGNCGLTELPDALFDLVDLEELYLCNEGYEYSFEEKKWNKFYSQNNGNQNHIKHLSPKISQLKNLKVFLANGWNDEFSKDKEWDLSDLTPLKDLVNLQQLYVSNTQVMDLIPLKDLTILQLLDISNTQVMDLIPLKDFKNLQVLRAENTQVMDLNPLQFCVNLQQLCVSNTQISDLTPLKDLVDLQQLYVSEVEVSDLTPLKNLINLQELEVHSTQVSDLTALKDLENLLHVYISRTQVNNLTPLKKVIEKGIPVKWVGFGRGNLIALQGCPLTNPPQEIVEQGNEAILRYWQQIEEQDGTVELYEAKMIIVGEGGTGKTTLFEKMKDANHVVGNTSETHGIVIEEGLEIKHADIGDKTFYANLWDFGGQELQYMTHQFFLTPRAFYVLMMDARKESPNLSYWFKIISLLGKESEESKEQVPLLLVFNKRKGGTGTPQYHDVLEYYKEHLATTFIEVDFAENDKRWECLKETIEKSLVNLPIVKSKLPKQWKPIREALRAESKKKPYISTRRLDEICSEYKITEERDQLQLSDYLHKLGSILHFQNDEQLLDTVILSPEWAVDGVYCILKDTKIRDEQHGRFTKDDIFDILLTNDPNRKWTYKKHDAQKILQLMTRNNFDICYESTKGHYVAAQHLPDNAPPQYAWHNHTGSLQFRYQYPIMPKGLMTRLIVRLSEYLEKINGVEIVWKKGAILRIHKDGKESRVLMKEDDAESQEGIRQIIIEVMGDHDNRKFALQRVRDEVEALHKKWFRSIKADEMIPCCCEKCKMNEKPKLYALKDLLELKQESALKQCTTGKMVAIQLLLEGVYDTQEIKEFDQKNKHHSRFDRDMLNVTINPTFHIENKPVFTNTIENKGLNVQDIAELTKLLAQLNADKKEKLKDFVEMLPEPETASEKETTGKQIVKWLNKNAEGIVGNVAASVYYDVLKGLLGIG